MAVFCDGNFYRRGGIMPVSGVAVIGGGNRPEFPPALTEKLSPENSTGLGSTSVQGTLLLTQPKPRRILDVANTYLKNHLTEDEMTFILRNRERFSFTPGVGDRRTDFISRFVKINNWDGEDVSGLRLRPNPPGAPEYFFTLTFSAVSGTMTLTDNHVQCPDTYGSLRYFTIRIK